MDTVTLKTQGKSIDPAEKKLVAIEATKKEINRGLLIFWLVSTVFLFLRVFLVAIGADSQALFVAFIYFISGLFLLPFWGIFPDYNNIIEPSTRFDAPALIAIFCYSILILLAAAVVWIIAKMIKTGKQVDETVMHDNPVDPTESEEVVK